MKLTAVDRELLVSLLYFGDNSRSNLAEITNRHPNSISDSRDRLESQGLIIDKGGGVLALTLEGISIARGVSREFEIDLEPPEFWGEIEYNERAN